VLISGQRPGTKVNLQIIRDGKETSIPVTLEQMNGSKIASASGEEHGKARWGLGLSNLTPDMRDELQVPREVHGAIVTNVEPGSAADNAGLSRGFVIEEVNRHPVQSAADVQRELSSIPKGQDVMLLVWNKGGSTFAVLHSPEAAPSEGGNS
jgi:serine protease Do